VAQLWACENASASIFELDANYVLSEDLDDDSNERDPFSFRIDYFNLNREYAFSRRVEKA